MCIAYPHGWTLLLFWSHKNEMPVRSDIVFHGLPLFWRLFVRASAPAFSSNFFASGDFCWVASLLPQRRVAFIHDLSIRSLVRALEWEGWAEITTLQIENIWYWPFHFLGLDLGSRFYILSTARFSSKLSSKSIFCCICSKSPVGRAALPRQPNSRMALWSLNYFTWPNPTRCGRSGAARRTIWLV